MAKKKAKLVYTTNDAVRKVTFKKRKKSLLKKVIERSTLYGIQACAIIYSTYQRELEVSPSPFDVQRTIFAFKKKSKIDQTKNMSFKSFSCLVAATILRVFGISLLPTLFWPCTLSLAAESVLLCSLTNAYSYCNRTPVSASGGCFAPKPIIDPTTQVNARGGDEQDS
ncbi:agamous-like MADS-box protein AGL80 [Quillaja saponaria]|uniref:Agamous-like MADS-box protein AGL80 n=1 Tax=Quillaja saponaria TaxID=32244 RepID=A0AAD7L326_QUISA|nr:agamous-like MADS-box protein AGL80 [Quillaja saponaria]